MSTLASRAFGLHAWANLMPGSTPGLHVRGAVHVRNLTDTVVLTPIAPNPSRPGVRRLRVVVEAGTPGLPALGVVPIAYEEDDDSQSGAVSPIFSDASAAPIGTIEPAR